LYFAFAKTKTTLDPSGFALRINISVCSDFVLTEKYLLNGVFERLAGFEFRNFGRGNLDFFAGARINAHASGSL